MPIGSGTEASEVTVVSEEKLACVVVPSRFTSTVRAIGDGLNRWPAAHRLDTARLYRLALEKGEAGARYHAVAEEGVPMRAIAETIGRGLNVPVVSIEPKDAGGHFGWLAPFAGWDIPASSAQTREKLGWKPTGPGLLADLEKMRYLKA